MWYFCKTMTMKISIYRNSDDVSWQILYPMVKLPNSIDYSNAQQCYIIMRRIFLQMEGCAYRRNAKKKNLKNALARLKNWLNIKTRKLEWSHTHMLDYNRKNFNADLGVRFIICTPQQIFAWSNQESDARCMWHLWEMGYVYSLLVGWPEGMKSLWRSWHRWEDNSKMDLQQVRWGHMDCMNLVQGRDRWLALVDVKKNRQVSQTEGNFTSWGSVSFWGRIALHWIVLRPITIHLCRHNWQTVRDFI